MQTRFQSSLQSGLQSDYAKSTSSFFGNILTTTTSKYNTLKRQLISSEADGDTGDDSHIARGLRAYYTEKGRQFPEWLPPDPKAPLSQPTQFVSSSSTNVSQQGYGGQSQQGGRWGRPGGGLSDLWGDNNRNTAPAATDSLRQRPGMPQTASSGSTTISSQGGRFGSSRLGLGGDAAQQETQSRPLPSQRAGSYQSQGQSASGGGRFDTASPPPSGSSAAFLPSSSGGTAQDRLKARLWGTGRTASPPPSNVSNSSAASSGGRYPYDGVGSSAAYGGQGGGGGGGSNPYATYGGDGSRYSGSGAPSQGRPGGDNFGAGGGGVGHDQGSGRSNAGLPSGPRAGRKGVGLPSGPRPQRF